MFRTLNEKRLYSFYSYVLLILVLAGCSLPSTSPATPPAQPTVSTTSIPDGTPTPTILPSPSATAQPTPSPSPEPTATLTATQTATAAVAASAAGLIALEKVAEGFKRPLYLADAQDNSGRLFVVEQAGRIHIVRDGAILEQPFVDLTDRVGSSGTEQGLLSVAFHPRFRENGYLYVNYTNKKGDTIVSRLSSFGDSADPQSETILLEVDQPYANHNGGLNLFGPDGMLYIGLGDGGSGGDPENRAQNMDELLGKILRIDVDTDDSGEPYTIPADNPFAQSGGRPEIWALGLRNPWRFSFDRSTGDMYIGDVGQNKIEEIDFQPVGQGGLNYGWKQLEGSSCYVDSCDPNAFIPPVAEYPHEQGCSVTAGYVYRSTAFPALDGIYFYGDYCTGTIWALTRDAMDHWLAEVALESDLRISSFGEDSAGELYVTDIDAGVLYRVVSSQ